MPLANVLSNRALRRNPSTSSVFSRNLSVRTGRPSRTGVVEGLKRALIRFLNDPGVEAGAMPPHLRLAQDNVFRRVPARHLLL